MQAMVAYIKFLSTGVPPASICRGLAPATCRSSIAPPIPSAAARFTRASAPHATTLTAPASRSGPSADLGYAMPPLWGPDSFNDGAGMARLINIANFVHFNMPHGADYLNPQLTVEDAWDVAAYVLSQPRPHRAGLDNDFPDLLTSRWTLRTVPTPTASASSSTSTARSRRSAPRSSASSVRAARAISRQ